MHDLIKHNNNSLFFLIRIKAYKVDDVLLCYCNLMHDQFKCILIIIICSIVTIEKPRNVKLNYIIQILIKSG